MSSYFGQSGHSFEKFIFQLNEGGSLWERGEVRDCDGFSVTFLVPVKVLRKGVLEALKEALSMVEV